MSFRRLTQVLGTTGASSVPKKEVEFIIVLIGDLYVGKTSAFVADPFSATVIPTTGELYICTMRDKHPNYQYTRLVMKTGCRSICLFYRLTLGRRSNLLRRPIKVLCALLGPD